MEDSLGTSSSSSASESSEESKGSARAREPSLRRRLARSGSVRVTRTRAAQRRPGERHGVLWGKVYHEVQKLDTEWSMDLMYLH